MMVNGYKSQMTDKNEIIGALNEFIKPNNDEDIREDDAMMFNVGRMFDGTHPGKS